MIANETTIHQKLQEKDVNNNGLSIGFIKLEICILPQIGFSNSNLFILNPKLNKFETNIKIKK